MPESKMYTSTFCPPFSIFCGFCPSQKDAEDANVFAQTPSSIVFCGARVSSEGSVDARFFVLVVQGSNHKRRLLPSPTLAVAPRNTLRLLCANEPTNCKTRKLTQVHTTVRRASAVR